ncbi:peptidoglycan-binding domain-containing protein [Nannocystis pusilla]|uniref:Peptidoglycan-binding domain-containing protein n=1 Tax=Nannocystis pusilla TaxID=889268 RepID=A0A9X3ETK7_9BACT|nr:peptidoglycan-binding domain-containing protein [Nannocystis pusilla]MCY1009015.1 peptidoglycan-binding domain-containing protein [Nannocystis pusilla]
MQDPELKIGSTGAHVLRLKAALAAKNHITSTSDVFARATHDAVVAFQKSRHWKPDGVVGPRTWQALLGPERELPNTLGLAITALALIEAARGVHEVGGNNRGPDVEAYQAVTGMMHQAWCASFVSVRRTTS